MFVVRKRWGRLHFAIRLLVGIRDPRTQSIDVWLASYNCNPHLWLTVNEDCTYMEYDFPDFLARLPATFCSAVVLTTLALHFYKHSMCHETTKGVKWHSMSWNHKGKKVTALVEAGLEVYFFFFALAQGLLPCGGQQTYLKIEQNVSGRK